ncbi:MAG: HyaD/HybD family hydrogenase maturation endopeptidase [Chloroflexota bacterium]
MEPTPIQTLVLGVGNLLMSDEGFGVHAVERLVKSYKIPGEVQVLDGGTLGMDLLYYLEDARNLLLVDAIQADREPGYMLRLEDDRVPAFLSLKVSPHQVGVPDMLAAARLRGTTPDRIVLWGVQPEKIELGLELSATVEPLVDVVVEKIIAQLRDWGHVVEPRTAN